MNILPTGAGAGAFANMLDCVLGGSSWVAGAPPKENIGFDVDAPLVTDGVAVPNMLLVSGAVGGFAMPKPDDVDGPVVVPKSDLGWASLESFLGAVPNSDLAEASLDSSLGVEAASVGANKDLVGLGVLAPKVLAPKKPAPPILLVDAGGIAGFES